MDPPFLSNYKNLLGDTHVDPVKRYAGECNLPVIDLSDLFTKSNDEAGMTMCKRGIIDASSKWGFFHVVNHGIPHELLERVYDEQVKVFRKPFMHKAGEQLLDFSPDSYRWGTPTATMIHQLNWSEAYHIPLTPSLEPLNNTRKTIEEFANALSKLAYIIAGVLADGVGGDRLYFKENCTSNTCYLRLNRYPPCPVSGEVFGMVPHTDSDFLTILHQDQVGGLQLMKNGRWFTVRPNPGGLIVNIGDLLQAWSNGVYKSVQHRVMSNPTTERFSAAFFLCPYHDTTIESWGGRALYRSFSFREYRQQVQEDVKLFGRKVGLARFLDSEV